MAKEKAAKAIRMPRATSPLHNPTKQSSRSKPSKSLKAALRAENNATVIRTGTVTAVRWDGTVNLNLGGQRFLAVACAQSYANRKAKDRVQVIMQGGMPFVLGAVGGDPDSNVPEIFPTYSQQYTWGRNGVLGQDVQLYVNDGQEQRVGRPGSVDPTYGPTDQYYQVVYSYWDGSANLMNGPADLVQSIDLFVGRSDWDEGDPGPAKLSLVPHKMDALPGNPQDILRPLTVDPLFIDFTLEAGEMKFITLPDDWRDNIGAATLDTNTIRGFMIRPQTPGGDANPVDNSYALLADITCAIRIYKQ